MRSNSRHPGRPSLLTPERADAVVRASAVGASTVLAAEAAGVSRATLARWIARGRAAAEAGENGVCGRRTVPLTAGFPGPGRTS
ncbi:hypothetical protein [Streptomyces sp. NPDC002530]